MKIAILNTFFFPDEPGGAEKSVRLLAESLVTAGHEVTVICLSDEKISQRLGHIKVEKLPIRNIYKQSSQNSKSFLEKIIWHTKDVNNYSAGRDVRHILNAIKPDVLHTNNLGGFSVSVWQQARTLGIPVVHTTRDFYLMCPQTTMQKGSNSCNKSCLSCLPFSMPKIKPSQGIRHVVGISQYILKKHLDNGFFRDVPATVIYNSFEAPPCDFKPIDRHLTLGYIGRIAPTKGIELLIESFRKLVNKQSNLKLHVAGTGRLDYVNQLKQQASDLPVEFLGHVAPEDFFPRIDVTTVPSIWNEPLGRVVIESLAYGKPVVANSAGGIPELMAPEIGELCHEFTPDHFLRAMESLIQRINSNHRNLYDAALEKSVQFIPKRIADSYIDVFKKSCA